MSAILKIEVEKFRSWASNYPESTRSGEWECDYDGWPALNSAFCRFIESKSPFELSDTEIDDLIYVIARDNEIEDLVEAVVQKKELFALLLSHVINSTENDAKWQFAVALGQNALSHNLAEESLLKLVNDDHEYTRRMALHSLGKIGSDKAEGLCIKAWETNLEYQRIMALCVLKEINSKELKKYLDLALIDGRKYLVQNANEIKNA
jgi:HEAT repeat protein